jgi:hypothetical protein
MYENPTRHVCLDECTLSTPHQCHKLWPYPCIVEGLEITSKEISTEILEKDLQDNISDLKTCEEALSQGINSCKGLILVLGESDSDVIRLIAGHKSWIETVSKELKRRVTTLASKV